MGKDSKAPGCGDCWCCQPDRAKPANDTVNAGHTPELCHSGILLMIAFKIFH